MTNVIGRENSITCGRTNELAHTSWTEYIIRLQKLYSRQNKTRQHYDTLPGRTASYDERTQTHTFENFTCLLGKLTTVYIPRKIGFQGALKCQGGIGFAQVFSALIVQKKLPERAPTIKRLHVLLIIDTQPHACANQ